MQPFETAWPIDHGSFVPWIATGPALRPAGQDGRERGDADRAGPERPARVGRDEALVHVVAADRRRRRRGADRDGRLEDAPAGAEEREPPQRDVDLDAQVDRLELDGGARTQPTAPFGRIGSWTRYQSGRQSAPTRFPSTAK